MKFGDKIKNLRVEKKLSQQALGELIGVSYRTIQNYESGV
ncbi:MAG: helix-turn-helix transcriptional regulator, partial [Lachnospiraceae bacterium]|nr:helix-turn-helix transcriptional regulator [Lachnospiraceae bacterium]